jgi:hypothetical protein
MIEMTLEVERKGAARTRIRIERDREDRVRAGGCGQRLAAVRIGDDILGQRNKV